MGIDRNHKIIEIEAGDGSHFKVGDRVKALVQPDLMITMRVDMVVIAYGKTEVTGTCIDTGKKATVGSYLINALNLP